jgi:YfiH family protein
MTPLQEAAPLRHPLWHAQWIVPDWPVPAGVRALVTTRAGGVSRGPYGGAGGQGGLNLGEATGDEAAHVRRNQELLAGSLPAMPRWLRQVHGRRVVDAGEQDDDPGGPEADAALTLRTGVVCAVRSADCLPVLLADARGRGVGAVHAGWRGLAEGVIEEAVRALRARLGDPQARLLAWLGPAIGPESFEVGPEVLVQMGRRLPRAREAFGPGKGDRLHADLFALARQALVSEGVAEVFGGGLCTVKDPLRFYSYRRDRVTGRQAALVWLGT